jgi:hypothetical protein
MKTLRALLFVAVACAFIAPAAFGAADEAQPAPTRMAAIQGAESSGLISHSQSLLYQAYAIRDPELLPQEYQGTDLAPIKCGTPTMMQLHDELANMPEGLRKGAEEFFVRPTLDSYVDTDHFRVHYSTSGANIIRGWPNTAYRDSVVASCEYVYNWYVSHGWPAPPPDGSGGGNAKIDCYVDQLSGVYGWTMAESHSTYYSYYPYSYTAYFVIDNDYTGFPNAPYGAMHVTVAHEYHHVIQMGMNAQNAGGWFMENTSTFMEDETYDAVNDNYQYLGAYTSAPWTTLRTMNGSFEYACFIWPTYLKERWTHSLVLEIWDSYARTNNFQTAFDSQIAEQDPNYNWDKAVAEWARWNLFTYSRDDGNHYIEGASYHYLVSMDNVIYSYPQTDKHPATNRRPQGLGTNFTRFSPQTGSTDNKITVTFRALATCDYNHRISFVRKWAGQNVYEEFVVPLDAAGTATFELTQWDQTDYLYMVAEMAMACAATGRDFSFDAVTEHTVDVASGMAPTRVIRLEQNAPNPFNPMTTIKYSISAAAPVQVDVYGPSGRHIRSLVDRFESAGEHQARWDGTDDAGRPVPAGVYLYAVQTSGEQATRKMIMVE